MQTNNVLEALKEILPQIKAQQEQPRSICFFANSVDMIHQLMSKLGIENESAVFCAEKSVEKLKKKGFKRAYEHWNSKHKCLICGLLVDFIRLWILNWKNGPI